MKVNLPSCPPTAEFTQPYKALQDTDWRADPADPTNQDKGTIQAGQTIQLHPQLLVNTADWQLACVDTNLVRYVRHNDFIPVSVS